MTSRPVASTEPAAWIRTLMNLLLAALKGAAAFMSDSRSLLADAIFSLSEAAESAARSKSSDKAATKESKLLATRKGSDSSQSSKIIAAVIYSVVLLFGAIHVTVSSVRKLLNDDLAAPSVVAGIIAVLVIGIRLFVFSSDLSKHEPEQGGSRFDAHGRGLLSSCLMTIGVIGAMTGQQFDLSYLLYLDPAAAILGSCVIVWNVYKLLARSITIRPSLNQCQEDTAPFIETVQRVVGVITVDELYAREMGHYIMIELKISVNPRISVFEANEIANRAKVLLQTRFSHVADVKIRVAPYDPGYPYKSNHEDIPSSEHTTLLQ